MAAGLSSRRHIGVEPTSTASDIRNIDLGQFDADLRWHAKGDIGDNLATWSWGNSHLHWHQRHNLRFQHRTAANNAGSYLGRPAGRHERELPTGAAGGTLTINPAPLTLIADNKSMGAGSRVPPLTVSNFGFVNGDTDATALSPSRR